MNRVFRSALLTIVFAVTAGGASAQTPPAARNPLQAPPKDHLQAIIQSRQDLGLKAGQINRIRQVRIGLLQQNEPLIARFLELRTQRADLQAAARQAGTRPSQAEIQRITAEAASITQRIEANNRDAALTVNGILTVPQRQRLFELIPQLVPRGRVGPAPARGGPLNPNRANPGRAAPAGGAARPPAPDTLGG